MRMVTLTPRLAEQAAMLAYSAYARERRVVTCLPPRPAWPELGEAACLELGVAALEQNRLVGFMCAAAPAERVFGSTHARGVFVPMGCHGSNVEDAEQRQRIYAAMYTAAARLWVRAGALSHAIALYAHDEALQRLFFRYGFGMRTVDAMQAIEEVPDGPLPLGFSFRELSCCEINLVEPLHRLLYQHFLCSPFFMKRDVPELAAVSEGSRYFVAEQSGKVVSYIKLAAEGETLIARRAHAYWHIDGACTLEDYRGQGIGSALLSYVLHVLRTEGTTRAGVDFESINPVAARFWQHYFTPYTCGVVRRIDERIVEA